MTRLPSDLTVSCTAIQYGNSVILDWTVHRALEPGAMRRQVKQRRVLVRGTGHLTEVQLTLLCRRLADYALASTRGDAALPRGLPWMEVGRTAWSVPPSGGEGGEIRSTNGPTHTQEKGQENRPENGIPKSRKARQNHSAPPPPGVSASAKPIRHSALDLPPVPALPGQEYLVY